MVNLDSVVVLWRQPDVMALWGIPYRMRPGQSPRDLWEGRRVPGRREGWAGVSLFVSSPGPLPGWVRIVEPGDHGGSVSAEERAACAAWLAQHAAAVPMGPCEWTTVAEWAGAEPSAGQSSMYCGSTAHP